ncbi:hypothetical protein ABZ863_25850 [Saccharomonospora sp. NPDC046836]|uniref:hypothetical protein n=1 Tax=Saccharomonospora sp. NPDC046836 TaxID=3156921 RepID=UPI0033CE458C
MSPKRGDEVAPPVVGDEWEIKYAKSDAVQGWKELSNTARGNARKEWEIMRSRPGRQPTARHHQLKGTLSAGTGWSTPAPGTRR